MKKVNLMMFTFLCSLIFLGSCSRDKDEEISVSSVTLNKTTLALFVGGTEKLTATIAPQGTSAALSWTSSAPKIATVDGAGQVTALAAGSANITASAGGKSTSCQVTISPNTVSGLSVNKTTLALAVGGSETLTATLLPQGLTAKISWTSSSPLVAKVDSTGKIQALAPGEATITASAGGKTASCQVSVNNTVSSLSVNKTSLSLATGTSETLIAKAVSPDALVKISWTSSAPLIAIVDSTGKVNGLTMGNATITASAGGKTATCQVKVSEITGITLNKSNLILVVNDVETLVATLNPAGTNVKISWTSLDPLIATVDSTGKIKAVREGAVSITASAGGKSVTCQVMVNAANIYIAGYEFNGTKDVAVLWKNGVINYLTDGTQDAKAKSVYVSGKDVYVVGYENDGKRTLPMLWKNGVASQLPCEANYHTEANSVFVSGNNVYVAGARRADAFYYRAAILWKNGVASELSTNDGHGAGANAVFVYGNDVYVAGYEWDFSDAATVWKNGVATILPYLYSKATAVFVSNGNIYTTFQREVFSAYLWKDGKISEIFGDGQQQTYPTSVYVYNDDVYITGNMIKNDGSPFAGFWKNGINQFAFKFNTYMESVHVYNGKPFIVGSEAGCAKLWYDAYNVSNLSIISNTTLSTKSSEAYAIFIK